MHAVHPIHAVHAATHTMSSPRHHTNNPEDERDEEYQAQQAHQQMPAAPHAAFVTTISAKSHHRYRFSFPRGAFASLYLVYAAYRGSVHGIVKVVRLTTAGGLTGSCGVRCPLWRV